MLIDGTLWVPSGGGYAVLEQKRLKLEADAPQPDPDGFNKYLPETFVGEWRQSNWKPDEKEDARPSAAECTAARRQRVRNKEKLKASREVKVRLTGESPPEALMRIMGDNTASTAGAQGELLQTMGPSATTSAICLRGTAARRINVSSDAGGSGQFNGHG